MSLDGVHKTCKHIVKRKKRYCRMTVKKGMEYCGEHMDANLTPEDITLEGSGSTTNKALRITCPLDSKHTCYAHNLKKHLKICNARPSDPVPHIKKDINSGGPEDSNSVSRQLSSVPAECIKEIVTKVDTIYNDIIIGNVTALYLKHDIVEEELKKPEYGDRTRKHLLQTSAILGLLKRYELLQDGLTCIEFGAGKGQLSYWIAKSTESLSKYSVLLVERASLRHKLDNKLEKSDKVQRIRADIADLVLDKVENISKNVVGVTKHLCGVATDLALRCLVNYQSNGGIIKGLVMSFCCHHRCLWGSYCGQTFFEKNGLTKADFDVMCGLVSWAVCGTGLSRDKPDIDSEKEETISKNIDKDKIMGFTREEKEQIGLKCKMILNWGRLVYLQEIGLECNLHYYVERDISLENVCIIAYKKM